MNKIHLLAGVAAGLALAAAALPAAAQSIDYGSLQEVFGEPVTTSANGSPQRSTEVPVDMTIISAAEIHRSGAKDLPTILSRVAGIDVLNWAARYEDVGLRGYNGVRSARILTLVNGRQVYLDYQGFTDWSTLPVQLSEIRQIEVVRGPNSALFGFNAVSGVINIITYNPKYDDINVAEVYGGTQQSSGGSLVGTFRLGDRVSMRLSGGADKQNQWANTSSTALPSALANPWSERVNLDAIIQLAPKAELRVEGSRSQMVQTEVNNPGYAYVLYAAKTSSGKATLTADTNYGVIQAQVYQNRLGAKTQGRYWQNETTVASLQDLFKIGANNTVRLTLEHRTNQEVTVPFKGATVRYKVLTPSVMWNWIANDRFSATAAVRYDQLKLERVGIFPVGMPEASNARWDRSINAFAANVGGIYKLTPADNLRLTYARGVQAPSMLEFGAVVNVPATAAPKGILTTGQPRLLPTVVTNYELAYDHEFAASKTRASVKVFAQKSENMKAAYNTAIIDVPATATTWAVSQFRNAGDSNMWGIEVAASGKFGGGFRWSADSTYTDVKNKASISEAELILRRADYGRTSPKFRSNLSLGWNRDNWTVDSFAHSVSKFNSYNGNLLEPVPAYTSFGGRVAYQAPHGLELALSGQNLLSERQSQAKGASGLKAERQVLFTITKSW